MFAKTKKIFAVVLSVIMALSCLALMASANKTDADLQFNDDGKFTILQMSDIQDGYPIKTITKRYIKDTLNEVKPDLVVLTGDNISGGAAWSKLLAKAAINEFMSIFEKAGVPVAAVFGNHDEEGAASKEEMMSYYEAYDCFVGCAGKDLTGVGNYNLPILSSDGKKVAFNIWCVDSGSYHGDGYDCIHEDQIDWYKSTAAELAAANGGEVVPSMMFQHIIVKEIYEALDKNEDGKWVLPEGAVGEMDEDPCPAGYTNGQFDAMLEMGDVLAIYSGHDHTNTFVVNYKGIDIINTPGMGFNSYDNDNVGSRVIVLDENDIKNYETYCLEYFDIYSEDDEVAYYLYLANSDTTDDMTKFTAWFKFIFASIKSIFTF